jgi:hypothetical protein
MLSPCNSVKYDVERIDVRYDFELRFWSKKFGVSPARLVAAVGTVGDAATDVALELARRKGQ